MNAELEDEVKRIVCRALGIEERLDSLTAESPLLGAVPEFDSMAVVTVLTELQEKFGIDVNDEDLSAATFASIRAIAAYVANNSRAG